MMLTHRTVIASGAAALAAGLALPSSVWAQEASDTIPAGEGEITIHPVSHASLVLETPQGIIYVDPVGEASAYEEYPEPGLILITHEHEDHYDAETLSALIGDDTQLIANPAVAEMLPDNLDAQASALANGETTETMGIEIEAIPAYNTTEDRLDYHPQDRGDNGYVLTVDEARIYIAGDTEDIPEMRSLEDIGLAFIPMNLPYTMTVDQAASAVNEFAPAVVYPYHYNDSDVEEFRSLVEESGGDIEVRLGDWY